MNPLRLPTCAEYMRLWCHRSYPRQYIVRPAGHDWYRYARALARTGDYDHIALGTTQPVLAVYVKKGTSNTQCPARP